MLEVNFLAVAVAAVAAFVASSVYYISLSGQLTKARSANPGAAVDMAKAPVWKKIVELVRTLVPAYVLAYLLGLLGVAGWLASVRLGFWLWVGFPATILTGSVIWENVPWRLAVIHAGDWLVKLLLMAVILGAWR